MRIALVAPEFPPEVGGMQRYAWEVARGLSEWGHAVTVFTRRRALDGLPSCKMRIITCLEGDRWSDKKTIAARANEFDIWHVMNAAWVWVAQFVEPVFVSIHGNDFLNPNCVVRLGLRDRFRLPWGSRLDFHLGRWMTAYSMRTSLPRVRHIFANSTATEAVFLKQFPICKGKTSIDFLGVSDFFLQAEPRTQRIPGPIQLITICRLSEPRKNVDIVLRALARLKDAYDFRYTIIGDGLLRPSLEQLSRDLGLADRVVFLGTLADDELRSRLIASDLFILMSSVTAKTIEGFGIVYLEANACGVPVLAARVGGAIDAVAAGRSGMFVEAATADAIEEALRRFLSGQIHFDPDACRDFARSFSWTKIIVRILDRYAERLSTQASG